MLLRFRHEIDELGPERRVEGFAGFRVGPDERFHPAHTLEIDVVVVLIREAAELSSLFALLGLERHDPAVGQPGIVHTVRVRRPRIRVKIADAVSGLRLSVPDGHNLVVGRPQRLVESLVVHVALFDVPQVGLAVERGGIAGVRQHLGHRHLACRKSGVLDGEGDGVHAVADRVSSGEHRRPARCTGRLRVHPREEDSLGGHAIDARCLESADLADRGDSHVAVGLIVPHDVNEVRGTTELLPKLGQPRVQVLVFGGPSLGMLLIDDVVLRVMDDIPR